MDMEKVIQMLDECGTDELDKLAEAIKKTQIARKDAHFQSLVEEIVDLIHIMKRCHPYASCLIPTGDCEDIDLFQVHIDKGMFVRL